jgi:sugar O-acyltransferase (sialic acid O-acetyltransferase NeuD family)
MKEHWYIYGAGGLGLETADILLEAQKLGYVGQCEFSFIEDNTNQDNINGFVVCDISECVPGSNVTVAVGEPATRFKLAKKATDAGLILANAISPQAFVSSSAKIGTGVTIGPFCSIQARAQIDTNATVNTMSIIGHDVHVKTGAVISSMVNLGGSVQCGAHSYVGMGTIVKEGLSIGEWSIISMGSAVFKDIPDEVIAIGNPARPSRRNVLRKVFNQT